jgi:hypothetical protein
VARPLHSNRESIAVRETDLFAIQGAFRLVKVNLVVRSMKVVWLFVFLLTIGFTFLSAVPSRAQVRPVDRPIVSEQSNERGLTLDEVFGGDLWVLAAHPLSPLTMSQVGSAVHQAPKSGIQFELLTPGDIGATIHIRW